MKAKQLFFAAVAAALSIASANAQNIFPATGNVGIGITAPTQKLHVKGGNLYIDNRSVGGGGSSAELTSTKLDLQGPSSSTGSTPRITIDMETSEITIVQGMSYPNLAKITGSGFTFQMPEAPSGQYFTQSLGMGTFKLSKSAGMFSVDGSTVKLEKNTTEQVPFTQLSNTGISIYEKNNSTYKYNYTDVTSSGIYIGQNVPAGTPTTSITKGSISLSSNSQYGTSNINIDGFSFKGNINSGNPYLQIMDGTKTMMKFSRIGSLNAAPFLVQIDGKLEAEEVEVKMLTLADYVFKQDYKLKPLNEVEKFIKENNHLPNVPSAKHVAENGLKLGQMQNTLLEKVEELTLYIIQQQKEIDALKAERVSQK